MNLLLFVSLFLISINCNQYSKGIFYNKKGQFIFSRIKDGYKAKFDAGYLFY